MVSIFVDPAAQGGSGFLGGLGFTNGPEHPVDFKRFIPGLQVQWCTGVRFGGNPVIVVLNVSFPLICLLRCQPLLVHGLVFFVGHFFYSNSKPPFYHLGANNFQSCSFLVVLCRSCIFIGVGQGSDDRMLASVWYPMAALLGRGCIHAHCVLVA